jgi:hypothetical protein
MSVEMAEIKPPERSRLYRFPGGEAVRLEQVTHLAVGASGTHRLRTADGKFHIVPPGWNHIILDIDDWTL